MLHGLVVSPSCAALWERAQYQWTGNAGTGDFGTPANWQPAGGPPGPSDQAVIDTTATPITGNGTAYRLIFEGTEAIAGQLTATFGSQANGQTAMHPGAALTTPFLGVAFNRNSTGTLVVGERSHVVIAGNHPPNTVESVDELHERIEHLST